MLVMLVYARFGLHTIVIFNLHEPNHCYLKQNYFGL